MRTRRTSHLMLTAALVVIAATFPSNAVATTAHSAATQETAGPSQDLRTPDAQDAARASIVSASQDLRSPDAREAAATPLVHSVASTPSVSDAFDWSDAGLGAAAMLALVALTCGTALLVGRGRHRTRTT